MQNGIHRLQDLFKLAVFYVPQYQRAYSWVEDPHLEAFLEDLRQQVQAAHQSPGKQYFLGTLLLHYQNQRLDFEHYHIVDGQQRLTTSVVFIASALELAKTQTISLEGVNPPLLRRAFIQDNDAGCQKFHTILEDEPFFQSAIIQTSAAVSEQFRSTPSSRLLDAARTYFQKSVRAPEWPELLKALTETRVMVYVVDSAADATQIFELQNDRGKRLTDLEALKSFLMHAVYLNATTPDDRLKTIQVNFAHIFRRIEELASIKGAPDEDAILSYYCVACTPWKNDEWRHPKKLVKDTLAELNRKGEKGAVIPWIEKFVGGLVSAFNSVRSVLNNRDASPAFSDLFVLGRLAPFWPLIIKTWQPDKWAANKLCFEVVCRLMEIYAFRGYAISNVRSDGGQGTLYTKARDFSGNYLALIAELKEMCGWYDISRRFLAGLDNPEIYKTDKNDARYLLWRYENYLRRETGQKQPLLSWRDYFHPRDDASRFSIEHITAQEDPAAKRDIEWEPGKPVPFDKIALHRLGNLVLDSTAPNAAKGKAPFSNKLLFIREKSIYLCQKELGRFTNEKDAEGNPVWGVRAIKERHQALVNFAKKEWDPDSITCPTDCKGPLA